MALIMKRITATCSSYVQGASAAGVTFTSWPFGSLDAAATAAIPAVPPTNGKTYIVRNGDHGFSGTLVAKAWHRYSKNYATTYGSRVNYVAHWSFYIPSAPAGFHLAFTNVHAITNGLNWTTQPKDTVAGASYIYEPEYSGFVEGAYSAYRALYEPSEFDYPSDDTMPLSPGVPMRHYVQSMTVWYESDDPDDPDNPFEPVVIDLTDEEADLDVYNDCEEAWFEYGIEGQETVGFSSTPHQYTTGILHFALTGLTPCTDYWYRFKQICDGVEKTGTTYWFKTKCTGTMEAITLGADDWWWMGGGQGLVRGMIKHTGTLNFYGHFGFQFRANDSSFTLADAVWLGTQGSESSSWIPPDPWQWPYQHVYNHLLPDRTYYYRAIWHIGRPPMTVDLYGATMFFSGVSSIAGYGYNHVTAKKAEDDISRLAAGRYYMDKSGVFQYESYQRRLA